MLVNKSLSSRISSNGSADQLWLRSAKQSRSVRTGICLFVLALSVVSARVWAASAQNANSPLGVNLSSINFYTSEQPLINIFLTNDGWITHSDKAWSTGEEKVLQLDRNGYPTTLHAKSNGTDSPQNFSSVGVVLERQGGPYLYPPGHYVVLYDGEGRLTYGGDAILVSSSPGRDVINIAKPSGEG